MATKSTATKPAAKKPSARGGRRAGAGRKPLPTEIKRIKGTLQASRANPNEPRPTRTLGDPPAYMAEAAKEAWRYAVDNAPPGLLTALDASLLERWANCADLYRQVRDKLNQAGVGAVIVKTPSGILRRSPLMDVLRDIADEMRGYESDMGFTPASRSRVSIPADPAARPDDPWAQIAG